LNLKNFANWYIDLARQAIIAPKHAYHTLRGEKSPTLMMATM